MILRKKKNRSYTTIFIRHTRDILRRKKVVEFIWCFYTDYEFLSSVFGYKGALEIKDFINFSNGIVVGCVVILHLMAQFYLQVDFDPSLRRDMALQRVSITPPEFYTTANNFANYDKKNALIKYVLFIVILSWLVLLDFLLSLVNDYSHLTNRLRPVYVPMNTPVWSRAS